MKQGYWIDRIQFKNSVVIFCNIIIKAIEGYYCGYCNYNVDIGIESETINIIKRSAIETWDFYNYSYGSNDYKVIYEEMGYAENIAEEYLFKEEL